MPRATTKTKAPGNEEKRLTGEARFNEEFIRDVITAIKNNTAPWQKSWQAQQLVAPHNALSGRMYSGRNIIRLALIAQAAGYEDPRWATFKQITDMGGKVRKDEKGTGILFFKEDETINPDGEKDSRRALRYYHVFNIEQTDLPRIQVKQRETEPDLQAFADILARHNPKIVRGEPAYRINNDTIYLPDKGDFHTEAAYYATALHELAHWTGHESRLNRPLANRFGSPEYAQEELVAELSSYLTSLTTGLPFEPNQSEAYLQHWAAKTGTELEMAMLQAFKDAGAVQSFLTGKSREQIIEQQSSKTPEPLPEVVATPQTSPVSDFFREVMFAQISQKEARQALGIVEKTFLAVPYRERQEAVALGAVWDNRYKAWFAPNLEEQPQLHRFVPDLSQTAGGATLEDFRAAASLIGLDMQHADLSEGKRHRVPLQERSSRDKDGEYRIFHNADGTTGAYAINYATAERINWSNRSHIKLTPEVQRVSLATQQQTADIARQIEAHIREQRSALAQRTYAQLPDAQGDEPYLNKKGIQSHSGMKRLADGTIVVPLVDGQRITSLQTITPNGDKRMMSQAPKQGSFYPIGDRKNPERVFIAEGVATAETVWQMVTQAAPGHRMLVVAAVDSNNLPYVADKLHAKYPTARMYIAADNDIHNEHKGLKNAGIEAARQVEDRYPGVVVLTPPVDAQAARGMDWNDYAQAYGIKAATEEFVRQSMAAKEAARQPHEAPVIDLQGLSGREAGRKLYEQTRGGEALDMALIRRSAQAAGFQLDEKKLSSLAGKASIEKEDAFLSALSPRHTPTPQKEYPR